MASEETALERRRARPRSRRWLRLGLIVAGIAFLLIAAGGAVAALWAFTILPRTLPSVTALESFQPLVGTKVLFLTPDKSLERKMKEAVLALELERRYSKDRILEMYLNQVYFGHGAYGVEAAARTYFGKSVSELNVREAALLGGLPRAPST